jgi:hypothetical protein
MRLESLCGPFLGGTLDRRILYRLVFVRRFALAVIFQTE